MTTLTTIYLWYCDKHSFHVGEGWSRLTNSTSTAGLWRTPSSMSSAKISPRYSRARWTLPAPSPWCLTASRNGCPAEASQTPTLPWLQMESSTVTRSCGPSARCPGCRSQALPGDSLTSRFTTCSLWGSVCGAGSRPPASRTCCRRWASVRRGSSTAPSAMHATSAASWRPSRADSGPKGDLPCSRTTRH
ncbi:uncharacterized protein LOC144922402 isoform X2 [Branchiostoma floridae x Branchiostoma belcheri]